MVGVTNGDVPNNGVCPHNGATSNGKDSKPLKPAHDNEDREVKKPDVGGTAGKYSQLLHAARRPLPTQSGDGSYLKSEPKHTSIMQDLRAIGLKGVRTLLSVRKHKKKGGLIDDKEYLMEQIIRVSLFNPNLICYIANLSFLVRLSAAFHRSQNTVPLSRMRLFKSCGMHSHTLPCRRSSPLPWV